MVGAHQFCGRTPFNVLSWGRRFSVSRAGRESATVGVPWDSETLLLSSAALLCCLPLHIRECVENLDCDQLEDSQLSWEQDLGNSHITVCHQLMRMWPQGLRSLTDRPSKGRMEGRKQFLIVGPTDEADGKKRCS